MGSRVSKRQFVITGITLFAVYSMASAADSNLLPNGDFSNASQISGWTAPEGVTISFSSRDGAGNASSGSMQIATDGSGRGYAQSGCFAVVPGTAFRFGGRFAAAAPGVTTHVFVRCTSYAAANCSGSSRIDLNPAADGLDIAGSGSFVSLPELSGTLDGSARAVSCDVYPSTSGSGVSAAFVDDLHFTSTPPAPPTIRLGGYLSGNWYDPAQSGQGFQLEFTDQNNTLLAIWFTYPPGLRFAPDGSGQRWIYAQAPYDTTTDAVTLPAEILSGGRFPPLFNSSDLHATIWGEMTFVFSDCNHGRAIWNSNDPGYGSGSMPISRLTRIRGTACPQ
jgi:hypothetical protein